MTSARDDPTLDAIIDALLDGPKDHDQIVRAIAHRVAANGSTVNSYLYTYSGRFFTPDRDPRDGKPVWTLSETVRRARRPDGGRKT